jgi:hypothetical protein
MLLLLLSDAEKRKSVVSSGKVGVRSNVIEITIEIIKIITYDPFITSSLSKVN